MKYASSYELVTTHTYEVEADSIEEAKDKAKTLALAEAEEAYHQETWEIKLEVTAAEVVG